MEARSAVLTSQFDNAGAMMSVDDTLLCSFQVSPSRCAAPRAYHADSEARGEEGTQVRLRSQR